VEHEFKCNRAKELPKDHVMLRIRKLNNIAMKNPEYWTNEQYMNIREIIFDGMLQPGTSLATRRRRTDSI
jgi:hypothetical protein